MCQQRGKEHAFSKKHVICAFLIMSLKSERKNSVSHGEIFLTQVLLQDSQRWSRPWGELFSGHGEKF